MAPDARLQESIAGNEDLTTCAPICHSPEGGNPFLLILLSRGCTVEVARLPLKHHGDDCKLVRYWNKERLPHFQQSSCRWISSGGNRGEQAVLRTIDDASIQARLGSRG
jgi:hypothetical protein